MLKPLINLNIAISLLILSSCGNATDEVSEDLKRQTLETQTGLISDGRIIVEENCTTCHAIGSTDESDRIDAPPLRTVLAHRNAEALAEDFRENIHVGATDMPNFDFGPLGTEALIAYLISIQETSGEPSDDQG